MSWPRLRVGGWVKLESPTEDIQVQEISISKTQPGSKFVESFLGDIFCTERCVMELDFEETEARDLKKPHSPSLLPSLFVFFLHYFLSYCGYYILNQKKTSTRRLADLLSSPKSFGGSLNEESRRRFSSMPKNRWLAPHGESVALPSSRIGGYLRRISVTLFDESRCLSSKNPGGYPRRSQSVALLSLRIGGCC
ncbi:BnaCnng24400D [Brassica napus]|uniref:BnaCnng24400D protein n=1 Tax=Brassica napus TaxID=3708 RepID=A0A078ISZ8_BRANA|nr:BnaCnng24400D [Brassica napus]